MAGTDAVRAVEQTVAPALADRSAVPVVVLSYACTRVEVLGRELSACAGLVCTSGTGIVPLCQAALDAWGRVERGGTSELAVRSVRAMVSTMVTVIRARSGAGRWCETALSGGAAASAFAEVFPGAVFVCFHRRLAGVVAEGLRTYPWGLGESPFRVHAAGLPGDSVAAIASYWEAAAGSLVEFEASHRESCMRVRYEDAVADPSAVAGRVLSWLGMAGSSVPGGVAGSPGTPTAVMPGDGSGSAGRPVPLSRLPVGLLERVSQIEAELGYGELA